MFKVGTVCVKIAGRDAGKKCVVIEEAKNVMVMIEGETRRRKCNVRHLEPVGNATVKTGASHHEVMVALGLEAKTVKTRKPAAKPSAHAKRHHKAKQKAEHKAVKKAKK